MDLDGTSSLVPVPRCGVGVSKVKRVETTGKGKVRDRGINTLADTRASARYTLRSAYYTQAHVRRYYAPIARWLAVYQKTSTFPWCKYGFFINLFV